MKGVIHFLDSHLRMSCPTVFVHIPEPFLDDAKQAQRNLRGHGARQVLLRKFNLQTLLCAEFLAEGCHSRSEAKPFECCGMQTVRQGMQIGAKIAG